MNRTQEEKLKRMIRRELRTVLKEFKWPWQKKQMPKPKPQKKCECPDGSIGPASYQAGMGWVCRCAGGKLIREEGVVGLEEDTLDEAIDCHGNYGHDPAKLEACLDRYRPKTTEQCVNLDRLPDMIPKHMAIQLVDKVIEKLRREEVGACARGYVGGGSCQCPNEAQRWIMANPLEALKMVRIPTIPGYTGGMFEGKGTDQEATIIVERHRWGREVHPIAKKLWWNED